MAELEAIEAAVAPANRLLVCDALMGRDAVNVAKAFAERIELDGVVLTKLDGDARGGAALAVKEVTGVPIKFIGTGEALDRLEPFRPEGLASRILGMGDVVGLVRDFERVADEKEAEEDAARLLKGQFGLDDLVKQLRMIQKMGPLKEVFSKLPGMGGIADQIEEGQMKKVESLIDSMTPEERSKPDLIDKSRTKRIARGSGRRSSDVKELVDRFGQMREMMASLGSGGMLSKIPGMNRLTGAGGLDPMAMFGGGGGGAAAGPGLKAQERQRSKQKGKRKQARKARRKNRKR